MAGTWRLPRRLIEALKQIEAGEPESQINLKSIFDLKRWEFVVNGGNSGEPLSVTELGKAALERHEVASEEEMAKKKAKSSGKVGLATRDERLRKKYPHYVPGSVREVKGHFKMKCEIKCQKCGKERSVFTSDVFQVKLCVDCKKVKPIKKKDGKKAQAKKDKAGKKSSKKKDRASKPPAQEPEVAD